MRIQALVNQQTLSMNITKHKQQNSMQQLQKIWQLFSWAINLLPYMPE